MLLANDLASGQPQAHRLRIFRMMSQERHTAMLIVKLAFRNIIGAGLRTWLNVIVLSIACVAIIWTQGFIEGMGRHAMDSMTDAEVGGGHFWHRAYDPFDPLTLDESHGRLSAELDHLVSTGNATPILVASGAIYPEGRIQSALLKGIDPGQRVLELPAQVLESGDPDVIPALIGARMARQTRLGPGDEVTVRWRDANGMFDATDIRIAHVMNTTVPTVDDGQIWLPIERLREMLRAPGEATFVVLRKGLAAPPPSDDPTWVHRDPRYLLKDIAYMIKTKRVSSYMMYGLLLGMALLAIFDTQVLAVFRRRKEIGTLLALGMARGQVIRLFALEGGLHGVMALAVGALYGIPLLAYTARKGLPVPEVATNLGVAVPNTLYPAYGLGLLVGTTLLVLITVTVVSFLPTRRISKLEPTDALRGRMT